MLWIKLFFITLLSSFLSVSTAAGAKWTYTGSSGPDDWGKLNSSYAVCSTGKSQSPIDISTSATAPQKNVLAFAYDPSAMIIEVDGPTQLFIGGKQTITNTGHGVQLNFDPQEAITFDKKHYHLVQFHFHTPSETKIDGKSYPMEIHFVHQDDKGSIAVIGVFVEQGADNATLQKIIDNIPSVEKIPQTIKGQRINPIDFIPADKNYYHFKGSLTTPPCSEGLEWIVLKGTITASAAQIAKLNAASHGDNDRPTQPLNGRKVFYTGG